MNPRRFIRPAGAGLFLLTLAGCSPTPPPAPARAFPSRHPPADCACTLEHRFNLCITVNGSGALPDSTVFVREREDGIADTLHRAATPGAPDGLSCFGEWIGIQRVLMLHEGLMRDSTGWFEIGTVDCCHGEARIVDFTSLSDD